MATTTTVIKAPRTFKGGSTPITKRVETQQAVKPTPFTVVTPLQFPNTVGETLKTTTDIVDGVIMNFKNMLLTNYGERLGKPDFGGNLNSLLAERVSLQNWSELAGNLIRSTTKKYMPYVTIDEISSNELKPLNDGFSRMVVGITFSIAPLGVQGRRIELTLTSLS